jgi:hypothetical protein
MPFLHQHCPNVEIRRVCFNAKGFLKIGQGENRSLTKCSLKCVECYLVLRAPDKEGMLLKKRCQRLSYDSKVSNEFPIIPSEPEKATEFLSVCWYRPILNCREFGRVSSYPGFTDNMPKI